MTAQADLTSFADAAGVSAYAQIPMAWAVAEGLIQGISETILSPRGTTTPGASSHHPGPVPGAAVSSVSSGTSREGSPLCCLRTVATRNQFVLLVILPSFPF